MLRVLAEALVEAMRASEWYDRHRLGLGDEFLDEVEKAFGRIKAARESFPFWEAYSGPEEIRRCRIKRFPYVVIYCCRDTETLVVAIGHARRRPNYWLRRIE